MAAKNPRIQVSLTPDTYALVKRLSDVTGESMSSIVAGVVEPSAAALGRLCVFMERASVAPDEYKVGVVEGFERACRRMEKIAGEMDGFYSDLGVMDDRPPYL